MKAPRPLPPPENFSVLDRVVTLLQGLCGPPASIAEQLTVLRLLATLRPDDRERLLHEVERLYPLCRTTRDRVKALGTAAELLAETDARLTHGQRVLLAMRDDG